MTGKKQQESIKDTVLKKIEQDKTTMRPKWYFVVRTFLFAAGIVGTVSLLFFVTSFILFILRQTGLWFVPIFGFQGVRIFITAFPWILIILVVGFVVLLEILIKRYEFAYKRPLLYSVVGIVILVALGGFLMAQTPFHGELYRQARNDHLPFVGRLYHEFGLERLERVHRGVLVGVSDDEFLMEDRDGESLIIRISSTTRFPLGMDFLQGDRIVVLGEQNNGIIEAVGIRKINFREGRLRGLNGFPSVP